MRRLAAALGAASVAMLVLATGTAFAGSGGSTGIAPLQPTVGTAAAFDKSPPLRDMQMIAPGGTAQPFSAPAKTDRSLVGRVANNKHQPDGALANDLALRELLVREIRAFRIYDGPSEVHRWSLAKNIKRRMKEHGAC